MQLHKTRKSPEVNSHDSINEAPGKVLQKKNQTGLPDRLKTGIENLSGYSMDDVRVHYNSPKPAQLMAHAYAQGNQIYMGPGQEKHLPHEAWHVVQQKQGRVRPTMQLKGVGVNDDVGLEKEADNIHKLKFHEWDKGQSKKEGRILSPIVQGTFQIQISMLKDLIEEDYSNWENILKPVFSLIDSYNSKLGSEYDYSLGEYSKEINQLQNIVYEIEEIGQNFHQLSNLLMPLYYQISMLIFHLGNKGTLPNQGWLTGGNPENLKNDIRNGILGSQGIKIHLPIKMSIKNIKKLATEFLPELQKLSKDRSSPELKKLSRNRSNPELQKLSKDRSSPELKKLSRNRSNPELQKLSKDRPWPGFSWKTILDPSKLKGTL